MKGNKSPLIRGVLLWIISCCLMFTAMMILDTAVRFVENLQGVAPVQVLSYLIFSAAGTFLQIFWFTETVLKKMKYLERLASFAVTFLLLLTTIAAVFRWFPLRHLDAWLLFVGIFVMIFVLFTIGFEIYYHRTGKKYDGLLGQYKARKKQEP